MKFKTRGTFSPETLIDIAQRASACLQDAGVDRVTGVSLYLTVVDKHGIPCPLCLDGDALKELMLDVEHLSLPMPAPQLSVGRPSSGPRQRSSSGNRAPARNRARAS